MKKLIDLVDAKAKEDMGDYYIVSKERMDNLISCFNDGAKRIATLTKIINEQQEQIRKLSLGLGREEATDDRS